MDTNKIFYLNNHGSGYDLLNDLLEDGIKIDYIITITPEMANRNNVSGYKDFRPLAEKYNIPIYYVENFNLSGKRDLDFFRRELPDLMLCLQWQRLIPEEIIRCCRLGCWGAHGSSEPLPKGRGRSPINWSLIEDKKKFILHLFWLKADADSGNILHKQEFDINPFDTCETIYHKVNVCLRRMVKEQIWQWKYNFLSDGIPQNNELATYYPKRTPEDGCIDFKKMTTKEIYNLVRAVTKPYPGAFCFSNNNKITIWKCQPFDTRITYYNKKNGEVVEKFSCGDFVVKTKDSSILITEYEGEINKNEVLF